ncbi:DedA family protein [Zafaria sp. Z1313]|uniref:DedA family protein n=1 Tax=Zafaria sp. Z1313 TaxID=3423202 RepID=UPI003D302888
MNELGEALRELDSWWIYPVGALFVAVSALLPPVPSTTLFVALGSLAVNTGELDLMLLGAAMFVGGVAGDAATFLLARRFNLTELPVFAGRRWQSTFAAARARLDRNGLPLVLTARFVPLGRLTINVAAALVPQATRRFMAWSVIASVVWSAYSVGVGALSGAWPSLSTEFAVVLAIAVSLILGRLITFAITWWENHQIPRWRRRGDG